MQRGHNNKRRNNRPRKGKPQGRRANQNNRGEKAPTASNGRTAHADLRYRTPLFPPKFVKRLVYVETSLTVLGTAGLVGNYFFSANGMYDPNVTGTGHQPMGFDQMMLMYNHFTVTASKISVTAYNNSASGLYAACGVYLSPDTTSITDASTLIENGFMVWKPVYPITQPGSIVKLNLNCNVGKYFARDGPKRNLLEDTDLYGTAAANPNDQVYFVVCAFSETGANNASLSFTVEIEYEAIFWEPRKLTQS